MLAELSTATLGLVTKCESLYIRKKALILALKTVHAAPEVCESFIKPCVSSLTEAQSSI